jgi:hypothetical protein
MNQRSKTVWALLIAVGSGMVGFWIGASTQNGKGADHTISPVGQIGLHRLASSAASDAVRVTGALADNSNGIASNPGKHASSNSSDSRDPRLLPKNGRMLRHEALINIWMNKGKGINALGLDPGRKAKLLNLLVDQYEAQQDAFDVLGRSGPVSDESGNKVLSSVSQAYEKEIVDFLGQSDYDKLQSVSQQANREASVKLFVGTEMEVANVPLSQGQLDAITAIEAVGTNTTPRSANGNDGLDSVDIQRLAEAAKILDVQQLAIYKEFLKDREGSTGGH